MRTKIFFSVFVIASLVVASCNKNRVYSEYYTIGNMVWEKDQPKKYELIINEVGSYNLNLELRHHTTIQYGSLEVHMKITMPSGKQVEKPYVVYLRDKKTGKLLGEAMGDICDTTCPLESGLTFPETGTYMVEIAHLMENSVLGIAEIGLTVDKFVQQ